MSAAGSEAFVRKAVEDDISKIYNLIDPYVQKQILLPRSKEQIALNLSTTWVVELNGKVVATTTIVEYAKNLYEIRAFVVKENLQKQGFGALIVDYILNEFRSRKQEPVTLFALTYAPQFFVKLGMKIVPKEKFPQKIFEACRICPRLEDCNEIAVEIVV